MQTAIATGNIAHATHATANRIALSFGLAAALPQTPPDAVELVQQVDLALYQVQQNGRDRDQINTSPTHWLRFCSATWHNWVGYG